MGQKACGCYTHPNKIEAAWKHSRFEHTKEESSGEQSTVVLHQPLQDSDEPEEEHVQR